MFSNILPQWEGWLGVHMISLAQVLMPLLTTSPSYSINGLHFESHDTREGKTHAWDEDFYDADGKTSDDKTFLKAGSPPQRGEGHTRKLWSCFWRGHKKCSTQPTCPRPTDGRPRFQPGFKSPHIFDPTINYGSALVVMVTYMVFKLQIGSLPQLPTPHGKPL